VTDYGLPSFLCGQDFQESEADQYKRKKVHTYCTFRTKVKLFTKRALGVYYTSTN